MSLDQLVFKYIDSAEHVLRKMKRTEDSISVDNERIGRVLNWVRAYLEDAKYYRDKKKFEVSLASAAYCEGLLDALRLLGAVRFEWPVRRRKKGK